MPSYKKSVLVPGKDAKALYAKVSSELDKFLSKTPIQNYELERYENQNEIKLISKMANLTLKCENEKLTLDGSLSMLAYPFKGKLDEGVDRWVAKVFNT